jgi:cyclin-dependent kinase
MEEHETQNGGIADRYKILKRLGSGTYGVVYQAVEIETDKVVALKKIKLNADGEGFPQTSVREIALLKQLNHPNIVK